MTKSEHVTAFRKRHVGVDKERLQLILNVGTKDKLNALAAKYGYSSVTAFLENLDEILEGGQR